MLKQFLTILVLTFPTHSFAQDIRLGVKIGGNLSWVGTGNQQSTRTSTSGYNLGLSLTLDKGEFGFQPEILYSKQGGEVAIPGFSYKEEYDYINIPVTMKFYIGKGVNIQGGPYFGILISATEIESDGSNETVNNIDDFIADTDYGFLAGLGYDLTDAWAFELRYNYGMTNVDLRSNFERRNRFLQLSVSYFLLK